MEKNERLAVERRATYERLYRFYRRMHDCVERAEAAEAKYRDVKTRATAEKQLELDLGTTLPTSLKSLVDREVGDDADAQNAVSDNRWYISYATMYATVIQAELAVARQRGVLTSEEEVSEPVRLAVPRPGDRGAGRGGRRDDPAQPAASRAAGSVPDVVDESVSETERCAAGVDNAGACTRHPGFHTHMLAVACSSMRYGYDRCRREVDHTLDHAAAHHLWHFPDCGGAVNDRTKKWITDATWLEMFDAVVASGEKLAGYDYEK